MNISDFDFQEVFNESLNHEIFKEIGLQKLNFLINETEEEYYKDELLNELTPPDKNIIEKSNMNNNNDENIIQKRKEIKFKSNSSICHAFSPSPKEKSICRKFLDNPQKFYTESLNSQFYKSFNITPKSTKENFDFSKSLLKNPDFNLSKEFNLSEIKLESNFKHKNKGKLK